VAGRGAKGHRVAVCVCAMRSRAVRADTEDIVAKAGLKHLVMIGALSMLTIAGVMAPAVGAGPDRDAGPAGESLVGTTLKRTAVIDLPGPPGRRFDYLAIDYDDHYLLAAHQGPGLLYVIDLRTNAVVKTIPGVPGIEGVAYIPEGKKVYTSNWYENKIGVVDLTRMAVTKKLPTAAKPDGIAYAGPFHRAYVSDERGKPRPWWTCARIASSRRCILIARPVCRSTIRSHARCTSICRTGMS
jgi:YVTN family beta-propeller protein